MDTSDDANNEGNNDNDDADDDVDVNDVVQLERLHNNQYDDNNKLYQGNIFFPINDNGKFNLGIYQYIGNLPEIKINIA